MTTRKGRTAEDATQFGFRWGPLDATRMTEYKGSHWLEVSTDFGAVEIYVSKTGRSIRVFKGGQELKPTTKKPEGTK